MIVALGQVQTRTNLNWLGLPDDSKPSIFGKLASVWAGHLVSNVWLVYTIYSHYTQGLVSIPFIFLLLVTNIVFGGFSIVVCGNTRRSIRKRKKIPRGFELSDYFLSFFYMRLVIAQLGRHTANYDEVDACICSPTGLPPGAEAPSDVRDYIHPTLTEDGSFFVY